MIIKGSNQPIRLEVDGNVNLITKLSCVLYNRDTELKKWDIDDVEIEDNVISLPLTETDTLDFPSCKSELEVKWLEEGNIEFAEIMQMPIIDRRDDTVLIEEGE